MTTTKFIAEIGCNHMGEMTIARKLVEAAARYASCDYVKFQKRHNRELLTLEEYNRPHPNPANSYGDTYGAHREYLEFSVDQHRELKSYCEGLSIGYSTSVWDVTSAIEIAKLEPDFIKVPSACNLNFPMLEVLIRNYRGDIHLSLGMTTKDEAEEIVSCFEDHGAAHRLVLYACTSGYPVPFEDCCLLEISGLRNAFGDRVQAIGYSGHHLGIAVDIAALSLGAAWIERHFTLDRTWKGTDHAASLEPDGLRKLVRDARAVERALARKPSDVLDIEQVQRKKLKQSSIRRLKCAG